MCCAEGGTDGESSSARMGNADMLKRRINLMGKELSFNGFRRFSLSCIPVSNQVRTVFNLGLRKQTRLKRVVSELLKQSQVEVVMAGVESELSLF